MIPRRLRAYVMRNAAELIIAACVTALIIMHAVTKRWPPL